MKIAYIMVGISGAGKSTAITHIKNDYANRDYTTKIFSLDECRLSFAREKLTGNIDYSIAFNLANENKKDFDKHVNQEWASSLLSDILFIDNTNLSRKSRARWCAEAKQKNFSITAVSVMTPLQVAVDRQATRSDKKVPESVVRDMYYRQQEVLIGDEADAIIFIDGVHNNTNVL